ncbi:MAG: hypothetical protein ACLFOC_10020 [Campylobacterales bacterium]
MTSYALLATHHPLSFLNPKRLTLSTNKNALIDKGLIKADAIPQARGQNFATAKQKKRYKYLLSKKGIEEKFGMNKTSAVA